MGSVNGLRRNSYMTIGPAKISPFGPWAAPATKIKSMCGEDDTGAPVRALWPWGTQPASPPLPALRDTPGLSGNLNQEVSMVLKFIRDHAWKFPSRPPLTLKRGAEGVSEYPPEPVPGVSGGTRVHTPRLSSD